MGKGDSDCLSIHVAILFSTGCSVAGADGADAFDMTMEEMKNDQKSMFLRGTFDIIPGICID